MLGLLYGGECQKSPEEVFGLPGAADPSAKAASALNGLGHLPGCLIILHVCGPQLAESK